jgi:hypothetical protein
VNRKKGSAGKHENRKRHLSRGYVYKGGKLKASVCIEVSTDGKSRTVTMRGIDAKGKKVMSAAVYDKQ